MVLYSHARDMACGARADGRFRTPVLVPALMPPAGSNRIVAERLADLGKVELYCRPTYRKHTHLRQAQSTCEVKFQITSWIRGREHSECARALAVPPPCETCTGNREAKVGPSCRRCAPLVQSSAVVRFSCAANRGGVIRTDACALQLLRFHARLLCGFVGEPQ